MSSQATVTIVGRDASSVVPAFPRPASCPTVVEEDVVEAPLCRMTISFSGLQTKCPVDKGGGAGG